MVNGPSQQGGFAAAAFVLLIGMGVAMAMAGWSYAELVQSRTARDTHWQDRLQQSAEKLRKFYLENSAGMDAAEAPQWQGRSLLAAAGVDASDGIQLTVGTRQDGPHGLRYRDLWLWYPPRMGGASPIYNGGSNVFTPGDTTYWIKVSGQAVQGELLSRAQRQLRQLEVQLKSFYWAHLRADPVHDTSVNWWQEADCSTQASPLTYPNGGIRCTEDDYLPIESLGLDGAAGIGNRFGRNPWGEEILGSNTADAVTNAPPYTMVLRSPYPWGGHTQLIVTGPM